MGCVKAVAWAWCVAAALPAAEPRVRPAGVPFGHADWRPSPTDPVGFAGQGNNWYPGATPPTEFWEGTPTTIKMMCETGRRDGYLSLSGPYTKELSVSAYADHKSKNILWKVPVPGWGDSLPIVVGKRVLTLHSPHHVVCWDADTGKVVWKDELKAMALPRLAADRKTLETMPDPAKAKKLQTLHELGLAVYRLNWACQPGLHKNILSLADRKPLNALMGEVATGLEGWKQALGGDFPEGVAAIDKQIAQLRQGMAVTSDEEAGRFRLDAFPDWTQKLTGVPLGNCWPGYISDTMATPVCDGAIVGVALGHGQVAAYELATGKRLWAYRDPTMNAQSVSHAPSPMIWKDLLIVTAGGGTGSGKQKSGVPTLLALDKRTGAVRWESAGGPGGCPIGRSHGDHMPSYLMRLPDGKGGVRALIISNKGAVLDAETGRELARLTGGAGRNEGQWGSGFVAGSGDLVFKTWGGDCSAPPAEVWQLKSAAPDKVEVTARPSIPFSNSHGPFALSDKALILGGKGGCWTIDPRTGKESGRVPGGTAAIAGKVLIQASNQVGDNGRNRQDRMCLASFTITDISDPAKPKVLSDKNLLGTSDMPVDIMDTYFPAIAKNPELKKLTVAGYHGVGCTFGVRLGGVTAHGSRLYIQSNSHLYCIGEK